jgi:hypothetical protein
MAANRFIPLMFVLITVLLPGLCSVTAQKKIPLLERQVTVSLSNEKLSDALKKIGDAGNLNFSYKSSLLDKNERVTYEFNKKTIREILDQLFNGAIDYRERGRYIILVKAEKISANEPSVLSGYVVDEATGKRLENVSIYDPLTLNSAVTDSYGFFKIEIKNPTGEEIRLAINKSQYTDTLVVVPKGNRRLLNIPIRFDKEKIGVLADSVGKKLKRFWLATKAATEQAINMENISDTMYRATQFGIVPFVGTNGKLSGNVINDYSLNLFGGYSLGNRVIEIAGLFNLERGDVSGFQAAGLINGVAGQQNGVQLAGIANASLDSVKGVQLSGIANFNARSGTGGRVAGIFNFMMDGSTASQIAGSFNFVIGEQRRPQVAGLFNFSTGRVFPAQVAGLFNFSGGSLDGAQVAGAFNVAGRDVFGAQISGLINVAPRTMRGAQVGLINFGRWSRGTQIGLINISSQMKGIPVGFLSIVGKGYHKLEISADEIFYTNLAFRTGVRHFYNILTVGANPGTFENDKTLWTFGYGVGTAPKLSKWLFLNLDVTSNQIVDGNRIEKINLLNKVYCGLDFQLAKGFSITAGITLNGHVTDSTYDSYPELFADYTPDIIRERNFSDDLNLKMWWGAKAGFRFF